MTTTMKELKKFAGGSEVELPGFVSGEPFNVKLKRPSLIELVGAGDIPNPLLATASNLFKHGVTESVKDGSSFSDMGKVLTIIAEAALVEPTYAQIKEAGITLTDMQLMHIYNFAQSGVDILKEFRKEQELNEDNQLGDGAEEIA